MSPPVVDVADVATPIVHGVPEVGATDFAISHRETLIRFTMRKIN
jgi:hypothetical protein